MAQVFNSAAAVLQAVGQDLGTTDWLSISQERIQTFADATGDHQWIHVDPDRARQGPFGTTIAHGYLTLSLANLFLPQLVQYEGLKMGVNYGCDKVRFPSPVPVGSKLRLGAELTNVEDIPGGAQVYMTFTFEVEGAPKPSCVSEIIFRYYE